MARDDGGWGLPGGVLNHKQSQKEGIAQRVLEDTGIHVKSCEFMTKLISKEMDEDTEKLKTLVAYIYTCTGHTLLKEPESETGLFLVWMKPSIILTMGTIYSPTKAAIQYLEALKE